MNKSYRVVSRFFVKEQGWKNEVIEVTGSYEQAGREASRVARALDGIYGNDHFWTVDVYNSDHPEHGSYYQLFHGRLS